jgi:N-methylhydantoinase A
MPEEPTVRYLGVDTGGTFTDLVEIDGTGRLRFDKAFSTPQTPEQGILDALATLAATAGLDVRRLLAETARFAHGTTVSTNALIQRRGARVGLIATRGFEDTLIIGRGPVGRAGGLARGRPAAIEGDGFPAYGATAAAGAESLHPRHQRAGNRRRHSAGAA